MHVATTRRQHKDKVYETHLLRRSYREDGKVKNETLANLSYLPSETIRLIRESLAGKAHVVAGEDFDIERALPHGHVGALWAMASKLDLAKLLGPSCRERDLALSLIIARAVKPASKLATTRWWVDTTLGVDLAPENSSTDDVYAAMDWLLARQAPLRDRWRPGICQQDRWCSMTCLLRGWKGPTARSPPVVIRVTTSPAKPRSNTAS